ncbi:MAG: ATP-binding cassette domain-containing protein, partial [Thermomicrobiales bacterium]|nr:ATP-binding cassette domain-containing protein [Thermomicrobiales bacterium]
WFESSVAHPWHSTPRLFPQSNLECARLPASTSASSAARPNAAYANPIIRLNNLRKVYNVPERESGLGASVRSLWSRETKDVVAVGDISFDVAPGEIVGFLGPNGAGKTTTLKMLSGLLHPSEGTATVLGYVPWQREKAYLQQMTLVMGQRNQLAWDIPVADSYELNQAIYRIPDAQYRQTLSELSDLLDLGPLLTKPSRNLSLGERMKCELAGALLHQPRVLFLDEPTLGLDITAQRRIRSFVAEYGARHNATVLLTSHYMADVEALAERVIVIHHGVLLFDGPLSGLVERFSPYKTVTVDLDGPASDIDRFGEVMQVEEGRITLQVPKGDAAAVTARLLAELPVVDLSVTDPPIDEVIDRVFNTGEAATESRIAAGATPEPALA